MRSIRPLSLCTFLTLLTCLCAELRAQESVYDAASAMLAIPSVKVGNNTYINVTLHNIGNYTFVLQSATLQSPALSAVATYDGPTATLTLPSVKVGAQTYAVSLFNTGNYRFTLKNAAVVQTYIYYSKDSTSANTATLANGTLTMGNLTLTNFRFGDSATDASGTLRQWASPWNNYNQPVVPAMLFCGADGKLAYVLINSAANDPDRITATAQQLVDSIQAASQYSGINIYRGCSGTFSDKWQNNRPASDFFQYSNIFTTYSYATVVAQLNGAAIYQERGTPSNYHTFLAITWRGGSGNTFEAWQ